MEHTEFRFLEIRPNLGFVDDFVHAAAGVRVGTVNQDNRVYPKDLAGQTPGRYSVWFAAHELAYVISAVHTANFLDGGLHGAASVVDMVYCILESDEAVKGFSPRVQSVAKVKEIREAVARLRPCSEDSYHPHTGRWWNYLSERRHSEVPPLQTEVFQGKVESIANGVAYVSLIDSKGRSLVMECPVKQLAKHDIEEGSRFEYIVSGSGFQFSADFKALPPKTVTSAELKAYRAKAKRIVAGEMPEDVNAV